MPPPHIASADFIAGMAKGMAVLESFDTERQRLNATLAAERAGITRAAARRHLLTLAFLGYLESDGHYFWLSPKVLRLSGSYLATARLPHVVQPTLNQLAAQTMLPFSVVLLVGQQVVIVARSIAPIEGGRVLARGLHLGSRLPAHATSTGKMLLASLPKGELREWLRVYRLPRLTAYTLTDAAVLRKTLNQVRSDDYCVSSEEHELGIHALAVPLRQLNGHTVAALNVVTTPQRLQTTRLEKDLLPMLRDAARELCPLL